MAIWGGGALWIRAAVRHFKLGWLNMSLMACALSIAEENLSRFADVGAIPRRVSGW